MLAFCCISHGLLVARRVEREERSPGPSSPLLSDEQTRFTDVQQQISAHFLIAPPLISVFRYQPSFDVLSQSEELSASDLTPVKSSASVTWRGAGGPLTADKEELRRRASESNVKPSHVKVWLTVPPLPLVSRGASWMISSTVALLSGSADASRHKGSRSPRRSEEQQVCRPRVGASEGLAEPNVQQRNTYIFVRMTNDSVCSPKPRRFRSAAFEVKVLAVCWTSKRKPTPANCLPLFVLRQRVADLSRY